MALYSAEQLSDAPLLQRSSCSISLPRLSVQHLQSHATYPRSNAIHRHWLIIRLHGCLAQPYSSVGASSACFMMSLTKQVCELTGCDRQGARLSTHRSHRSTHCSHRCSDIHIPFPFPQHLHLPFHKPKHSHCPTDHAHAQDHACTFTNVHVLLTMLHAKIFPTLAK